MRCRAARLTVELLEERALPAVGFLCVSQPTTPPARTRVHIAEVPDDPRRDELYGLNNIAAPDAWNLEQGSTSVVVGVIDTGIDYTHPDLYRNVWLNQDEIPSDVRTQLSDVDGDDLLTFWDLNDPHNRQLELLADVNENGYLDGGDAIAPLADGGWADGIDDDDDGHIDDLIGWNFVRDNNDPFDDNEHGSHVAGTIGAVGNNGVGVVGVNWRTQLMALKFLNARGSGDVEDATAALNYAVAHGARIVNNSWGGGGFNQDLFDAIKAAGDAGVIYVAAAGNRSSNNDRRAFYPASYALDNVVAVAATDSRDRLASFSNYGVAQVDLAAPGVDILSTLPNERYDLISGTSMAAPHVSGVLALLASARPELSGAQLIQVVVEQVDPVVGLASRVKTGGRLNAFKALTAALAVGRPDTTAPCLVSATPNGNGSSPVSALRVVFDEAIDPATFSTDDVNGFPVQEVRVVPGTGNRQFDILFTARTSPGSYSLDIGPDIADRAGNALTQGAFTATFTILAATASFKARSLTEKLLGNLRTTTATLNVKKDFSIGDVGVKVTISHAHIAELVISLVAPDGTTVVLVDGRGDNGRNFTATKLDDEADHNIALGAAPFTGTFRPEESLGAFDGKNARGTWRLLIEDRGRFHTGKLKAWSLTFAGTP